jgi:CheY-like chemotaxis protein
VRDPAFLVRTTRITGELVMDAGKSVNPHANTIRLVGPDLARLYAELDAAGEQSHPRREFLRWPFPRESIQIELQHAGGATTRLNLACRNISTAGMSLLHNAYVHVGTPCLVHLPQIDGKPSQIPGRVVRCRHVRGLVHELGIQFTTQINLRSYIRVDPLQGSFTLERVAAEKLVGSVLHIEDSAADRRLLRHFLRNTQLTVLAVENGEDALRRAPEGFDIIIADFDLPDITGAEVVEKLRAKGVQTPVIMVTALSDAGTRARMIEARVSAILIKPISEEQILRAIAEFMILEGGDAGGPVYSTIGADDPAFGFIPEYLQDLRQIAGALSKALQANDTAAARRLCAQVKGSAPSLGFAPLAGAAEAALKQLNTGQSAGEAARAIKSLIALCVNARVREQKRKAG